MLVSIRVNELLVRLVRPLLNCAYETRGNTPNVKAAPYYEGTRTGKLQYCLQLSAYSEKYMPLRIGPV